MFELERLIHLIFTDPYMAYIYVDTCLLIDCELSVGGIGYGIMGALITLISMYTFDYVIFLKPIFMFINWVVKSIITLIIHLNVERLVSAY